MSNVPKYPSRPHKSGQARIKICGQDIYLGVHGSAESKQKYARVIAEAAVGKPAVTDKETITVARLLIAFMKWANSRYIKNGKPTSEITLYKAAIAPVADLYSDISVDEFGPLALHACQMELLARGHCRSKINQHTSRIRRVFRWGVSKEIVRNDTWQALTSVAGLERGEAPDRPRVVPVSLAQIEALKPHVMPPVWAMVQLQLWTGMRPGEVLQMRTCDLTQADDSLPEEVRSMCWVYRPSSHKTEHHERTRLILLGPQAQEVVAPWLRPEDPERFLFSPAEAVAYARARRIANAKTHRATLTRKANPRRAARDHYDIHAYETAIERGCEKAYGMPQELRRLTPKLTEEEREKHRELAREWRRANCWSPNRIRHTAATVIRQRYGIEVARVILGHASLKTSEVYAELDIAKAAKAMSEMG